jgi:hypothetical protein
MRFIALLTIVFLSTACTNTYTMLDGDDLYNFWVMSHPVYEKSPLRITMPDGQYAFTGKATLSYRGMECFVNGEAVRTGTPGTREVHLPMYDATRMWLDMYLRVIEKNGDETELQPGYWYFSMSRGVPLYLMARSIDPDPKANGAIRERSIRYNDVSAVGWRSGYYSPILDFAVEEGLRELGIGGD